MNTELQKQKEQIDEAVKSIEKQQDELFKKVIKSIFADLPAVKIIKFTGYVPSFNDGDPCTFRSNAEYPTVNGYSNNTSDWEDNEDESDDKHTEEETKAAKKLCDEVADYLILIPDDAYEREFGSNFEVTITPDEITKEYYDCGY